MGERCCAEEFQISTHNAKELRPTEAPVLETAPRFEMRMRESIVVLTHDDALASAVRAVTASEHDLVVVSAEMDLATHLMGSGAGVVMLDSAALTSAVAVLTSGLKAQFPDVVLIVAGGANDQAALAAQVTSGAVYRFLHKPASEQRIRLFVDAAWRRRGAEHSGGNTTTGIRALAPPAPPRRLALPLGMAALAVAAAAGIGGWLMGQGGRGTAAAPPVRQSAPQPALAQAPATDAVFDQLLTRAAAALARGDLVLPAGASAADLYRQALEHHPGNALAQAGLDKVVDQMLSSAEQNLLAQHLDEAEHFTQAARAIQPDSVRVSFLTTQLARERERAARAQARQQQLQQQHEADDEFDRQQKMIVAARAALTAGNLDEAARLIASAADAGIDHNAIDTLNRDLQGARLVAKMNETLAKTVPAVELPPAPPVQTVTTPAPPAAAPTSEFVSASSLERLKYVEAEYPPAARAQGKSGWVDLAFDVEIDGSVGNVSVMAAEPKNIFDNAAATALRKWRFRPVQRDGHPVVQRARLRIRFAVQ